MVLKLTAAEATVTAGGTPTGSHMKFNFVNYAQSYAAKLVYQIHRKSFIESTPASTGKAGRRHGDWKQNSLLCAVMSP